MRARAKTVLIGAGLFCAGCAAGMLVAMVLAWHAALEQSRRERDAAAEVAVRPPVDDSVVQLPSIVARSDPGGVVVTLGNDSSSRTVVITDEDRLVVEYESVRGGALVRKVPVAGRTIAPGETAAPLFIPLEGGGKPTKVQFEHREPNAVARTEVTIP